MEPISGHLKAPKKAPVPKADAGEGPIENDDMFLVPLADEDWHALDEVLDADEVALNF